jgi:thermitase
MHSPLRIVAALTLLAALAPAQNRPDPLLPVANWQGFPVVAGELLVQFKPGVDAPFQAAAHAALGGLPRGPVTARLSRVGLPAGADLEKLRARYAGLPEVEFAQPNVLHRPVGVPDDPLWTHQWGHFKVRADVAWDTFAGAPTSVVAVIDSGIDADHVDLGAQLAWGLDTFAGDPDPDDTSGHGTHCSGVAAALTGNGVGMAGAAPACRLAAYRCGNSTFPSSALVAAINDAVARGAQVLSLSWGSSYDDPAIRHALQQAVDAGCLVVAAAGNDNSTTPFFPAALPFVLAVGATDITDGRASFSNFGLWVDLAAPGQGIQSTWIGGQYKYLSGTSMACPLVAGAGALLYARLGSRTPEHAGAVRAALEASGVPVGDWVTHGRLDMAAALDALLAAASPALSVPASLPAGSLCTWSASGPTGDAWYLLLSLSPQTFNYAGSQLLVPVAVLSAGPLDAAGLDSLQATIPTGGAGLTFRSQVVTWDGSLSGSSPIHTTLVE